MTTQTSEQSPSPQRQSLNFTLTVSSRGVVVFVVVMLLLALTAVVPNVMASEDLAISESQVLAPDAPDDFSTSGTINFQGELTQVSGGSAVPDGDYFMRFAIYDAASGGNKKWPGSAYETQTVSVSDGLFNAHLGAVESHHG